MKTPLLLTTLAAVALTSSVIHAAVITGDGLLVTGANQIDPTTGLNAGRNDINLTTSATGGSAANKATLEGVSGYGTIQQFTGLDASTGTAPDATGFNIWTFTDRPDMRISFLGESGRNAGSGTGGAASYTSGPATPLGGESLFFGTAASNVMTIEFGTYASSVFTADQGVAAAGFTFSRNTVSASGEWRVSFFDGATLLSAQSVSTGSGTNLAALFGYVATGGQSITSIQIGGLGTNYNSTNAFVDDIGFAAVPEPSTVALLGLGAFALAAKRRRRKS